MNSSIRKIFVGTLAMLALAFANQAGAIPINGEITFSGGTISLGDSSNNTTTNALAATQILGYGGTQTVNTGSGSYAGIPGVTVSFSDFKFSDSGVTPLWTFSFGPLVYSFDATSIVNNTVLSNFLNISGSGTAYISGPGSVYDPSGTAGVWSITSTTSSTTFTFGASTTVPDSGTTAMLMGVGMLGIAITFRRFKKSAGKA